MHNISLDSFRGGRLSVVSRKPIQSQAVQRYLDEQLQRILKNRGVDHPFLHWYRDNALTPQQERVVYLETACYFRHVLFYICSICTLTRDESILREVLANVRDELGTEKSHSELFGEFLRSIGISAEDEVSYQPLETTHALNQGIFEIYTTPPLLRALGGLYAEETQSAAMVAAYNAGLLNQGYSAEIRHFWTLHIEAEIGHSNSVFNCIHPYLEDPENQRVFERGIDDYMKLLENYWDGVQARVLGLAPS